MKSLLKRFEKWYDLNVSWFFVNGRKQDSWCEHLKEKYPEEYKSSK